MRLEYFDLLSPEPIQIQNIGGIISPTLRNISSIGGYNKYQHYLSILLMDLKAYLELIGQSEIYDSLSDEEKSNINIFELLTCSPKACDVLRDILNFFIFENVAYSSEHKGFLVRKESEEIVGVITKETYPYVCDVICQRNGIKPKQEDDMKKVKSKKALEIMKKLREGRNKKRNNTKEDKNMDLGNVVSAVANKSNSLNIMNIWDLTVFQIWDCFSRISNNNIYDIQSMSVAAWGNKDNYFDATAWFKRIDTDN